MAHKGHPDCPYTSKAKCEKARRQTIGPCIAMLDESRQCSHLGTDTVGGRAYCGQHIGGPYREADERERRRIRKQLLNDRIDAYLAETAQQPHECGDHCEFSGLPQPTLLKPQPNEDDLHWTSDALAIDVATGATVRRGDHGYEEVVS